MVAAVGLIIADVI